jgi:hypothetical protein
VILFWLFAVQKHGTAGIGKFFGPITLVWFVAIAVLGVSHIVLHPEILWAISPHYALGFMWASPWHHLHHPGRRGAVRDRRRGAVRRHGALRQEADPAGLVLHRHARRSRSIILARARCCWRTRGGEEPLLHDGARLGADSPGGAGDGWPR